MMEISVINTNSAFSAGKKVWLIDSNRDGYLRRKIDWHLNFLLLKAESHKKPELAPQMLNIIAENEMPSFHSQSIRTSPLLIPSEHAFPVSSIVEIPWVKDKEHWVTEVHKTWQLLGEPEIRVFLPQDLSANEFKKLWPKSSLLWTLEVVPWVAQ